MSGNNTAYILNICQSKKQVQQYLGAYFFASKPKFDLERFKNKYKYPKKLNSFKKMYPFLNARHAPLNYQHLPKVR